MLKNGTKMLFYFFSSIGILPKNPCHVMTPRPPPYPKKTSALSPRNGVVLPRSGVAGTQNPETRDIETSPHA